MGGGNFMRRGEGRKDTGARARARVRAQGYTVLCAAEPDLFCSFLPPFRNASRVRRL